MQLEQDIIDNNLQMKCYLRDGTVFLSILFSQHT